MENVDSEDVNESSNERSPQAPPEQEVNRGPVQRLISDGTAEPPRAAKHETNEADSTQALSTENDSEKKAENKNEDVITPEVEHEQNSSEVPQELQHGDDSPEDPVEDTTQPSVNEQEISENQVSLSPEPPIDEFKHSDKQLEVATPSATVTISEIELSIETLKQSQIDHANQTTTYLESLKAQMNDFNSSFQLLVDHFDKLHAETQRMRQGELQQALTPMLRLLLTVIDTIDQLKAAALHEHELEALDHVGSELADILLTWGVEEDTPYAGEPFNANRHTGVAVTSTQDFRLDRKIARIARRGFNFAGATLRRAEADVYRYTENKKPV